MEQLITMQAPKLEVVLSENGTLVLERLLFQARETIEVIIIQQSAPKSQQQNEVKPYPLRGQQPYHYDDPFEPASAKVRNCPLLTADQKILGYPAVQTLK